MVNDCEPTDGYEPTDNTDKYGKLLIKVTVAIPDEKHQSSLATE